MGIFHVDFKKSIVKQKDVQKSTKRQKELIEMALFIFTFDTFPNSPRRYT